MLFQSEAGGTAVADNLPLCVRELSYWPANRLPTCHIACIMFDIISFLACILTFSIFYPLYLFIFAFTTITYNKESNDPHIHPDDVLCHFYQHSYLMFTTTVFILTSSAAGHHWGASLFHHVHHHRISHFMYQHIHPHITFAPIHPRVHHHYIHKGILLHHSHPNGNIVILLITT